VERLRKIRTGKLSLADISIVFVSVYELRKIKRITEIKYDLYENVVVKRRKTVSLTFEEVSFELRPKIAAILN
jgi:hypothetical protein